MNRVVYSFVFSDSWKCVRSKLFLTRCMDAAACNYDSSATEDDGAASMSDCLESVVMQR